jgi:glycosyltransferase involved in cell wall biosynthesis
MGTCPLVTVLTPVYNGEEFIAECVDSVLAQTYRNFEYVIVDNASTDRTGQIVAGYAARDPRIRVATNERLVPVIENHNIAIREASPESRYYKFVSADDAIFPECLERMVAHAGAHPSVGLVSAYRLQGDWVDLDGLPYPTTVVQGSTICRWSLLGFPFVFGPPSSHMIRADLVRARDPFYDESALHADEAACYEVLRTSDFGFVHQVLSWSRVHRASLTFSVARRLNTLLSGRLKILMRYGPLYLSREEYEKVLAQRIGEYYRFLAQALVSRAGPEVWGHHRDALRELGIPFSRWRVVRALLGHAARVVMSPGTEIPKVVRLVRERGVDDGGLLVDGWPDMLEAAKHHMLVKQVERREAAAALARAASPPGAASF